VQFGGKLPIQASEPILLLGVCEQVAGKKLMTKTAARSLRLPTPTTADDSRKTRV